MPLSVLARFGSAFGTQFRQQASFDSRNQQPNSQRKRATLTIERPLALRLPSCVARSQARVFSQKNAAALAWRTAVV
jgi:hypothetical protein